MTILYGVYDAFRSYERRDKTKTAEWKQKNSDKWEIIQWVKGLRNG